MSEIQEQAKEQAPAQVPKMRPIWYFVGWMLIIMGTVVTATGIWEVFQPPAHKPVLWELHTGIWWGAVTLAGGIILQQLNKNKVVG